MPPRSDNPVLRRLDRLVGTWRFEASIGGRTVGTGTGTAEWIEGGTLLVLRSEGDEPGPGTPRDWVDHAPFPVTQVIGLDDAFDRFTVLYADARGVSRVYAMTLDDDGWRMWRDAPGFNQRFAATVEDGGNVLAGAWEVSEDGVEWRHDFDLRFVRAG